MQTRQHFKISHNIVKTTNLYSDRNKHLLESLSLIPDFWNATDQPTIPKRQCLSGMKLSYK